MRFQHYKEAIKLNGFRPLRAMLTERIQSNWEKILFLLMLRLLLVLEMNIEKHFQLLIRQEYSTVCKTLENRD